MFAFRSSLGLALAAVLGGAVSLRAQTPATPAPAKAAPAEVSPAPEVGVAAPDFTAPAADANGPLMKPVSLASLKGKVVVLAFYPGDRTSGCTAELSKFRDEYATLFGKGVVVLPISVDGIDSHASWAKDMKFPFALVSDPDQSLGKMYGSAIPGRKMNSRTVFVIGKDGTIRFRNTKFGALNEDAYKELAAEVAKAKG
ncbi:MAG TPA: peroxiredoxin family protein [Longimicrobiales bacterium]|nr:peroxiredoxin family protein [Longimicrobiales bacterium]